MQLRKRCFVGLLPLVALAAPAAGDGLNKNVLAAALASVTACPSANTETVPGTTSPTNAVSALSSTEQQTQLGGIFQQLLTDIQNLRANSAEQVRTLLTPAQQSQMAASGLQTASVRQQALVSSSPNADPDVAPQFAGGEFATPIDRWQQLPLTDAQRPAVREITDSLQAALEALQAQADTDFRALPTPDQTALLDQLSGQNGSPNSAQVSGGQTGSGSASSLLQLSAEQLSQAATIVTQLKMDTQLLQAAAETQILALLSDQSGTQAGALQATPGTDPSIVSPDALTQMTFSPEQGTAIASVLSGLQDAIRARVQQAIAAAGALDAHGQAGKGSAQTGSSP